MRKRILCLLTAALLLTGCTAPQENPSAAPVSPAVSAAPTDFAAPIGDVGLSYTATAALTAHAVAHTGQPGQQILILGKLHLQSAFLGLGPLGKDIQNQRAAVQNRNTDNLFQCPHILGR